MLWQSVLEWPVRYQNEHQIQWFILLVRQNQRIPIYSRQRLLNQVHRQTTGMQKRKTVERIRVILTFQNCKICNYCASLLVNIDTVCDEREHGWPGKERSQNILAWFQQNFYLQCNSDLTLLIKCVYIIYIYVCMYKSQGLCGCCES